MKILAHSFMALAQLYPYVIELFENEIDFFYNSIWFWSKVLMASY